MVKKKEKQSQSQGKLVASAAQAVSSNPREALSLAVHAASLGSKDAPTADAIGHIFLELGEDEKAMTQLLLSERLEALGSSSRLLTLAQLAEGAVAAEWYGKALGLIRQEPTESRHAKLCSSLCALAELYMTDLCMLPEAEAKCEEALLEAMMVDSSHMETLQTFASMRISQQRTQDAQTLVRQALETWIHLEPTKELPAYELRLNQAKLCMETDLYEEAQQILQRLVEEEDSDPEVLYLNGLVLYEIGNRDLGRRDESWQQARGFFEDHLQLYEELGEETEDGQSVRLHVDEMLEAIGTILPLESESEGSVTRELEDYGWESE